jgi:hypothetical protein
MVDLLLAIFDDALSLVIAVKPIGDDYVAERRLAAHPCANSAHGDAGRIELDEQLPAADCCIHPPHLPEPRGGDREGTLAGTIEAPPMVREAPAIVRFDPALTKIEHGEQLVLQRRKDEHIASRALVAHDASVVGTAGRRVRCEESDVVGGHGRASVSCARSERCGLGFNEELLFLVDLLPRSWLRCSPRAMLSTMIAARKLDSITTPKDDPVLVAFLNALVSDERETEEERAAFEVGMANIRAGRVRTIRHEEIRATIEQMRIDQGE